MQGMFFGISKSPKSNRTPFNVQSVQTAEFYE